MNQVTDPKFAANQAAADRFMQRFFPEAARRDGARIAAGGGRAMGGAGNYVEPTLYLDAGNAMRIANDVRYGLTGCIWTRDIGRAHRVARDLDAGMIWSNSESVRHLGTPFGGVKQSGIGRDGGDYSFEFYMETKNVAVAYDNHAIPRVGA